MRNRLWVCIGVWLLVSNGTICASAEFEAHDAKVQAWDAVICGPEGILLMAVYDRAEVWKVDPATGEALATARVGRGPVALAVSADRGLVACLNNLDGTVSFVSLSDLTVSATISCPKGSFGLVALPDGRFAGVSSFSNALWVIDPRAPAATVVHQLDAVPNGLAANGSFLAVTTASPPGLVIFSTDLASPPVALPIDGVPAGICPCGADRFAVATPGALLVIDAKAQQVVAQDKRTARSIASDRDRLAVLQDGSVAVLDASLALVKESDFPSPGCTVRAWGDYLIVLSPKTRTWYSSGAVEKPLVVAKDSQSPAGAPTERPIVKTQAAGAKSAPATVEAASGQHVAQPSASGSAKSSTTAGTGEPTVPKGMPPPHEFGPPKRRSPFKIERSAGVSPETSFVAPDWTQPLRDIEADLWETELGSEELNLKGHVHLDLGMTSFSADEFQYNEITNEVRAKGNVLILQEPSELAADQVYYRVAEPGEVPRAFILEPALSEQERAERRLSLGYLDALNVTVREPGQELHADKLTYNIVDSTGNLENAAGRADIYYFGGKRLRILGPASLDGEDIWVTTCDRDPPHYRIRIKEAAIREGEAVYGRGARLYIGETATPLYWPRWGYKPGEPGTPLNFDFSSGHRARIGYYVNTGMQFGVTPDVKLGLRLFPTTEQGVGLGLDSNYDFMENPASPLFLGKGTFHSLYTTEDRGYLELRHRQEIFDDTVMLLQVEQWSDSDFYKDFYWDRYKDRTAPRTFVNVTYTQPDYIATGTVRAETNGFVTETEQLPEVTYHLLQRPVAKNLYVSFDTINGYYETEPHGARAARSVNVGRVTYDVNVNEALNLMPFIELEGTFYSQDAYGEEAETRLSGTFGTTLQTRLSRTFPGAFGFSGFKHVIVPSITYSYRPSSTMNVAETPWFDAYDAMSGRSRFETKIDNVVFGRDARSGRIWEVGRLSLFQGNDLSNEIRTMEDYEAELQVQPRPWWGWRLNAERHRIDDTLDIRDTLTRSYTSDGSAGSILMTPSNDDLAYDYLTRYGDYNSLLTYLFYDDTYFNGKYDAKMGFSYTQTGSQVFNREILCGLGYRFGENWGMAFEQRYDFARGELTMQKYQIRRRLHCWDAALTFRDRQIGWDFGIEFNIAALPGSLLKF